MNCYICNCDIPTERVEALQVLGTPPTMATCIVHASNSKVKGIYFGESGLSPLVIVQGVGREGIERENT